VTPLFSPLKGFFSGVIDEKETAMKKRERLVKDWMSTKVVTIAPNTSLIEAHRLMADNNIRRLPVLKNDRLVGIVTRGDVRGAEPSQASSLSIWEINYLLARLKIADIMTKNPLTALPEMTIGDVAKIMLESKISGLPVVDDTDKVVGIITESDIFRMIVQSWQEDD
jgi:acetoin utilization protein AcuB